MKVFPIARLPNDGVGYSSRFDSGHEGIDIFAALGTPVVAVADGVAWSAVEPRGGNAVYLREADGTQYYYAHLDAFAEQLSKLGSEVQVKAGEVIGTVGATGNASGKAPHIHFEMRPQGGAKVDPFWALQAAEDVQQIVPSLSTSVRSSSGGGGGWLLLLLLLFGAKRVFR